MRAWLIALLLLGCDDPAPVSSPATEIPTTETPAAPTESSPEASDPEEDTEVAAAEPGDERAVSPVNENGEASSEPSEEADSDDPAGFFMRDVLEGEGIPHPDPRLRRVLEHALAQLDAKTLHDAEAQMGDGYDPDDEEDLSEGAEGGCRVELAHPHLVSLSCTQSTFSRMDTSYRRATFHFVVAGDEVQALDPRDVFTSRAAIESRLRAQCESDAEEAEEDGSELPYGASCESLAIHLESDLVKGQFARIDTSDASDDFEAEVELYYEDLAELIPEDGILRALFAGRAPPAPSAPDAPNATAISHTDVAALLVAQWQRLPAAQAARVGLARGESGVAQLVYVGDDPAEAATLATLLGASPRPIRLPLAPSAYRASWMQPRSELNVRAFASGPVRALIPPGTLLAPVDPSDRGRYVEVDLAIGSGFVGRNVLRAYRGCVPRAPQAFDASRQPMTVLTSIHHDGTSRDGVLFAQSLAGRTRVALYDFERTGCEVGAERARIDAAGDLRDVRLTTTSAEGGSTLVVVGTRRGDREANYEARVVDGPDAVWSATVRIGSRGQANVRLGESVDGVFFPVTFSAPRLTRLAWTGSALEPRTP